MEVVSVNASSEKGTVKAPVPSGVIDELGLMGDAHAGSWHRQVSLLGTAAIERFAAQLGRSIAPGEFAENLTVRGLEAESIRLLDRLRIGEVELAVTQIGKECHGDACAIFRETGLCVMPQEGIFTRVQHGGPVRTGDEIRLEPRALQVRVLTLSDRASAGRADDRSGPLLRERLEGYLDQRRFRASMVSAVLSDDPSELRMKLEEAIDRRIDLIFASGGTGLGPRDHAPEVVTALCDRLIPGPIEAVRMKSGLQNPHALLTRAVAGVAGPTIIFALPGSPRAVTDYLDEICRSLDHLILMVHGLGH